MSQPAATILRNVFQFATILNQASNADVQKWDSISISNALDWADYCQEVLFQYIRQTMQSVLQVKSLQRIMWNLLYRPTYPAVFLKRKRDNYVYLSESKNYFKKALSINIYFSRCEGIKELNLFEIYLSCTNHKLCQIFFFVFFLLLLSNSCTNDWNVGLLRMSSTANLLKWRCSCSQHLACTSL